VDTRRAEETSARRSGCVVVIVAESRSCGQPLPHAGTG
jgi:hypothetical protein